jgi:hypothetical protein
MPRLASTYLIMRKIVKSQAILPGWYGIPRDGRGSQSLGTFHIIPVESARVRSSGFREKRRRSGSDQLTAMVTPGWLVDEPMVITMGTVNPDGTPCGIMQLICSIPAINPGAAPA